MDIEILGTLASVIILIGFTMKGERKIRLINIFGAILFVIYGIIIKAFSIWFLNSAICFIHIYYLSKKSDK